jgi:hypothetical protein
MITRALSWGRTFFPQGYFTQVPATAVQEEIRQQLGRWGLPAWLRVDNGYPWGNFNDLPTALSLWLVGLGVQVHWNEPRRPQQNAKVERSQGTGSRWAEPWTSSTVAELPTRFDREDQVQRALYPSQPGGRSRLAAYPALFQVQQRYTRTWERRHWDLHRAVQHLAEYQAVRKVSTAGHVGLYDHAYYVGRAYAGQAVYVQLNPDTVEWMISDAEGREVRKHAAQQITRARLLALNLVL